MPHWEPIFILHCVYVEHDHDEIIFFSESSNPITSVAVTSELIGYSYLLVLNKETWEGARAECASKGYGLAKIESQEEESYIRSIIKGNQCKSTFPTIFLYH